MANFQTAIDGLNKLEKLAKGDSVIHRCNAFVKVISCLTFIICVISVGKYDIGKLMIYAAFPIIIMSLGDIPFSIVFKRTLIALPFAVFAGVSNIIFDRAVAISFMGVAISFGFISFVSLILKTFITVSAVFILIASTPVMDIFSQMIRMKIPNILVVQLMLIYRYISVLLLEVSTSFMAYKLRAPGQKGISILHSGSFVGSIIIRSADKASRVYYAMKCRGFDGEFKFVNKKFTITDAVGCLIFVIILIVIRCV